MKRIIAALTVYRLYFIIERERLMHMNGTQAPEYIFKVHIVGGEGRGNDGIWLNFPASAGEITTALEQMGPPVSAEVEGYLIDRCTSKFAGLEDVLPGQRSVWELNEVAQSLATLSKEDRKLLAAVQESPSRLTKLEQLREFPSNLDYFVLEPRIKTMESLGWRYLDQHLDISLSPVLRQAVDPRPFGQVAMEEDKGCFTKYGYLSLSGDEWQHERIALPPQHEPTQEVSIRDKIAQIKKDYQKSAPRNKTDIEL